MTEKHNLGESCDGRCEWWVKHWPHTKLVPYVFIDVCLLICFFMGWVLSVVYARVSLFVFGWLLLVIVTFVLLHVLCDGASVFCCVWVVIGVLRVVVVDVCKWWWWWWCAVTCVCLGIVFVWLRLAWFDLGCLGEAEA